MLFQYIQFNRTLTYIMQPKKKGYDSVQDSLSSWNKKQINPRAL